MDIRTGATVYETIFSVDGNGAPITGATFTSAFYIDGVVTTGITLTLSSINPTTGAFTASFSSDTYGFHQYVLINSSDRVIYVSEIYVVKPNNEIDVSIFVGL
jgi:hypothetical protein